MFKICLIFSSVKKVSFFREKPLKMLSYQDFEKLGLSDLFLNIWSYGAEQKNDQVILKYLHWNIDLAKKTKSKWHKDFYDFDFVIKKNYNNDKQFY